MKRIKKKTGVNRRGKTGGKRDNNHEMMIYLHVRWEKLMKNKMLI